MSAYNFVRSGPNFAKIFLFNAKKIFLVNAFQFCRYLHRFQRYLWPNSKVVVKRTKFWTFFALPNFKGAVPPKIVLALTPQPKGTSSAKVSSGYTP